MCFELIDLNKVLYKRKLIFGFQKILTGLLKY